MNGKELRSLIDSDLYRYRGNKSVSDFLKTLIVEPGFRYMYIWRKCKYYRQSKLTYLNSILARLLLSKYMCKYGYEIPVSVQIGKGFYIGHMGGIAVNSGAVFGNNVNISKGVTVGGSYRGQKKGVPVIGNLVWIGSNAVLVGNIRIGDNVLIAPNAYVNFDVPNNSIVIGNPATIIKNAQATSGYINNIV